MLIFFAMSFLLGGGDGQCIYIHTMIKPLSLCSGFHYETNIGICPYRTLAVVLTEMYGS